MPRKPFTPNERELEIVAEWSRIARLMQESVRTRLEFEGGNGLDRVSRYCLLKTYLNDALSQELSAQGQTILAREFRASQRKKYADLLNDFSKEVMISNRIDVEHRVAFASWSGYQDTVRSAWRIQLTILELRIAFLLHGLGISAGKHLASRACKRIRGCFPPAEVIPITS